MNKIQFEQMLKPLISIFDEIELDLIRDIILRVDNYDGTKGSLKWYLDKLNETKVLDKDLLKDFKKNKGKIKKELMAIMRNAGNNTDNLDTLKNYYEKGLLDVNPIDIYNNTAINNIIGNALKDGNSIIDLIQTKAIEGASEAYKDVLNKAYVETASGVYTYTESIRRALDEYGEKGIQTVHYKNGKSLSIESIVRRDVRTRINKLSSDVILQHAKDLGTNLVYVDQHLGARVRTKYMKHDYEAHAEWQGKKYMIEGSSKEYPNLYEITGLGEMLGLYGINCYHNMRPSWEWEKIDPVIDEIQNAERYEQYQTQRGYERKIRKLKRKQLIAKETSDIEELKKVNEKLKKTNSEFDNYLKENNLTRDYNREYIPNKKKDFVLESEGNKFRVKIPSKEIVDRTKTIISNNFAARTAGIKIKRDNINYSYIDEKNNVIVLGVNADEYALIHELGHRLQSAFTKNEKKEYNRIIKSKFNNYVRNDFEEKITYVLNRKGQTVKERYWVLKNYDKFVSSYQTRIYNGLGSFIGNEVNTSYALEYFSEGIKYFYKKPELLKEKDLELYNFISEVIKDE